MTTPPARRTVLGTGAAFLLAGCSKYGASSSSSSASPTTTTSPIASSKPSADRELAEKSHIPVGGGKVFKEQKVVVTQPKQGEFKAFSAICTHQGCTVSKVADGTIDCPCHGSKYRITDASVVAGPAPRPQPAKKITMKGKSIFLA
jgi:Rieske Fe-S protein